MTYKVIIEESRQANNDLKTNVVAIINQDPAEMYNNYKLYLQEIAAITKKIQSAISEIDISNPSFGITKLKPTCKYRLDMKIMVKDDVDFYMSECDRIIKGCTPTPVYETISDFVEVYKRNVDNIIKDFKKYENVNNKPLR